MSAIPFYPERLKAMIFRTQFAEKVEEIKPVSQVLPVLHGVRFLPNRQDLEAICLASVQLQSSKSFKRVLEVSWNLVWLLDH